MRITITRPRTITARKIHAASKSLPRSAALRFIDFSTRRKTTDHNGQANNTKEKSCRLYRRQRTNAKSFRCQSRYNIRAHRRRSGHHHILHLSASDRASLHHHRRPFVYRGEPDGESRRYARRDRLGVYHFSRGKLASTHVDRTYD